MKCELVIIHKTERLISAPKKDAYNTWRRRRHSALCAERHAADCFRAKNVFRLRTAFARTRGNSRVFTSPTTPKKDRCKTCLFLAQKTRFELVLRFSHTTPLAGEPLEPLGYFCMAQYSKAILLYHIFFALSKLFALKNKKSSQNFLKRLTIFFLSFIIALLKIF